MENSEKNYLVHLTEVNKTNAVMVAEDIFNQKGVLVAKKGLEVNRAFAFKVAKHKLFKPLEHSVALSNALNYEKVLDIYKTRIQLLKLTDAIESYVYFEQVLSIFKSLIKYPLIVQKLTVLSERMPDVFGRCLVTSALAFAVSVELGLSEESIEHVFLANIISDVGLLHIDPKVVNKKGVYNIDELKMMQGHVVIAKHFADAVPLLPKRVGRAVLEHHERVDGFGYPFAKTAQDLCEEGQVISIVDKASGLFQKLIKNGSYSWHAIIAIMQVPSTAHSAKMQGAMMRVLRNVAFEYKQAFDEEQYWQVATQSNKKRQRLHLWFSKFEQIYIDHRHLLADSNDGKGFQPLALLEQARYTVIDSGILSDSQNDWINDLPKKLTAQDCRDLEEFGLVLGEVEYQCFFILQKFVAAQEELAKRFGSLDLPELYYEGLMSILKSK